MWLSLLYGVGLFAAYFAGAMLTRLRAAKLPGNTAARKRRFPYLSISMVLTIGITSIPGLIYPSVLTTLERNYSRFLSGEWWRLVTSLFVQDGGTVGTIFNLVSLLFVGGVAEQYWSSNRWLLIFFGGGILSQLIAFSWQPVGAGNSVANFSLAGSIAIVCLFSHPPRTVLLAALLSVAVAVSLLFFRNIHGAAAMAGMIITAVLLLSKNRNSRELC